MKIPFEWEDIYKNFSPNGEFICGCDRTKVIGGWIVKSTLFLEDNHSQSMVFVPDPNHNWEV